MHVSEHGFRWENPGSVFFKKDAIQVPAYQLRRFEFKGKRYYYDPDIEADKMQAYPSVTSIIKAGFPESRALADWRLSQAIKHGYTNAGNEAAEKAAQYGTFFHMKASDYLSGLEVDLGTIQSQYAVFLVTEYNLDYGDAERRSEREFKRMTKDLIALASWVTTNNVQPLVVEGMLRGASGFASAVDLVCLCDVPVEGYWGDTYKSTRKGHYKEGDPKLSKGTIQVLAIGDFKKSPGKYPERGFQLTAYDELVRDNFPDLYEEFTQPVEDLEGNKIERPVRLWNISPKDWRLEPSVTVNAYDLEARWSSVKEIGMQSLSIQMADERVPVWKGVLKMGSDAYEYSEEPLNVYVKNLKEQSDEQRD